MTTEEWRPVAIPGVAPGYTVSSLGRVRSERQSSARVLSPRPDPHGYPMVTLRRNDGKFGRYGVHRLVLTSFVGPRPEGHVTRHLDGDQTNNRLDNLRYGTFRENNLDTVRHGRHPLASKTHCLRNHPLDDENTVIGSDGHRRCRTCRAELGRKRRAASKRLNLAS